MQLPRNPSFDARYLVSLEPGRKALNWRAANSMILVIFSCDATWTYPTRLYALSVHPCFDLPGQT
jgi:hypothetical protein